MTKSNFMRVILVVGSALILVGVSLTSWMLATEDERSVIEVKLENGKTQSVEFKAFSLIPGEQKEYKVSLDSGSVKKYDLSLKFVETKEKTLKNFARVKVIANDTVICDDLLAEAFEKENMILQVDVDADQNTELIIVYYLPIDVGNEAKNAEAEFELLLTASNE